MRRGISILRRKLRRSMGGGGVSFTGGTGVLVTLLIALGTAWLCVSILESRLRPMVVMVAQAQTQTIVTKTIEDCVVRELEGVSYGQLVHMEQDAQGNVIALTTDMAAMNTLRARLLEAVLEELEGLDVSQIHIPLGSLVDLDILWGLGPELKVHAMTVGTVEGEFESSFSSAGVNQTLHRIELVLHIPLTLMLPAGAVETNCDTRLCVAETVIVGQVPQFYLAS